MLSRISEISDFLSISKVWIRNFRGVYSDYWGILGLEGGEGEAKRGSGTPTTEHQKKFVSTMFVFFFRVFSF